jgi:hypothetical protein
MPEGEFRRCREEVNGVGTTYIVYHLSLLPVNVSFDGSPNVPASFMVIIPPWGLSGARVCARGGR